MVDLKTVVLKQACAGNRAAEAALEQLLADVKLLQHKSVLLDRYEEVAKRILDTVDYDDLQDVQDRAKKLLVGAALW